MAFGRVLWSLLVNAATTLLTKEVAHLLKFHFIGKIDVTIRTIGVPITWWFIMKLEMFPICKRDFWAMVTRKHLGCECRKKSADGSSQQLKSFYHQLSYMRLLRCALKRVVCKIVKGWLHVMHDSFACVHSHGSWVETCRTRVRIPGG